MGRAILDILVPRQAVPETIFGRPVHDLTGGRPDTPEWIMFMMIVDRDNMFYDEYFGALESFHDWGHYVKWARPILRALLPKMDPKHKERCETTIRYISSGH